MISFTDYFTRIGVALCCGAAVGVERQWRQRNAGLRTCTLVAIGSALFVTVAVCTPSEGSPTRIAAQVVTGVGFLGAGVIMRSGLNVRGLNTAGTLWCSSAIGTLAGSGLIPHAVLGTSLIVLVNVLFRPLARMINRHPSSGQEGDTRYLLQLTCRGRQQSHMRQILLQYLQQSALRLQELDSGEHPNTHHIAIKAVLTSSERLDTEVENLANRLGLEPGVMGFSWEQLNNGQAKEDSSVFA